jgi:uncharacterized protein (TIGR03067 family)
LIVLLAVGVPAKEDRTDESKQVMENLQGEWQMIKADFAGLPGPPPMDKELPRFVIKGNRITIVEKNRNEEATFTVDLSKKPYVIDIRPVRAKGAKGDPREELLKGIFDVTKDTLKITIAIPDFGGPPGANDAPRMPDRPADFNPGPNVPTMAIVFQRVQPK